LGVVSGQGSEAAAAEVVLDLMVGEWMENPAPSPSAAGKLKYWDLELAALAEAAASCRHLPPPPQQPVARCTALQVAAVMVPPRFGNWGGRGGVAESESEGRQEPTSQCSKKKT
jgi:hypothetical protein